MNALNILEIVQFICQCLYQEVKLILVKSENVSLLGKPR